MKAISKYHIGSDDHVRMIEVPEELYTSLIQFLDGDKPSGSLELHFRNGGICEITGTRKVIYKGANQKSS